MRLALDSGSGHASSMDADACVEALDTWLNRDELLDLIEQAFLNGQIDGETLTLAFAWLEGNHPVIHQRYPRAPLRALSGRPVGV